MGLRPRQAKKAAKPAKKTTAKKTPKRTGQEGGQACQEGREAAGPEGGEAGQADEVGEGGEEGGEEDCEDRQEGDEEAAPAGGWQPADRQTREGGAGPAYVDALPGWKRDVGRRIDEIITRNLPGVRKAVKWNSPFYGIDGQGWLINIHAFTRYLRVTFFPGPKLDPVPPGDIA